MITPAPCFSIAGKSARSRRTAGKRLRSSARCHSRSSSTAKPPAGAEVPPTTCTTMSIPPNCFITASATAAQPSAVATFAVTNSSSAERSAGRARAVPRTAAPASRSRAATAWPTPLVAPVTSARRPASSRILLIGFSQGEFVAFASRRDRRTATGNQHVRDIAVALGANGRAAVQHSLHFVAEECVGEATLRCAHGIETILKLRRNLERQRRDVLRKLRELRGSYDDRRHPRPVRNPIQCDLGHAAAELLRNGFKLGHDGEIARREGRQGRVIGALEHLKAACAVLARAILAGEQAVRERRPGHDAHAVLAAERHEFMFDAALRERVFELKRGE